MDIVRWGDTIKGRLVKGAGDDGAYLTANAVYSGTQDSATKSSWWLMLFPATNAAGSAAAFLYQAPGSQTLVNNFNVNGAGDLSIAGPTAIKATGTTWANPSDRRLKREITDYQLGLSAIAELRPRAFVFNGKGGSTDGLQGYGFIADEVASVMPEMVRSRRRKLDPADAEETDLQMLDTSTLVLALVNAVKELAARVAALEAA